MRPEALQAGSVLDYTPYSSVHPQYTLGPPPCMPRKKVFMVDLTQPYAFVRRTQRCHLLLCQRMALSWWHCQLMDNVY